MPLRAATRCRHFRYLLMRFAADTAAAAARRCRDVTERYAITMPIDAFITMLLPLPSRAASAIDTLLRAMLVYYGCLLMSSAIRHYDVDDIAFSPYTLLPPLAPAPPLRRQFRCCCRYCLYAAAAIIFDIAHATLLRFGHCHVTYLLTMLCCHASAAFQLLPRRYERLLRAR